MPKIRHFELVDKLVVIFVLSWNWGLGASLLLVVQATFGLGAGGLPGNPCSGRSPRASPSRFSLRMSNGARDRRLGAFLGGMGELARHEDVRHVFGASFVQRVGAS